MDNSNIDRLLSVMAQLRHPDHGCPWDIAQDFASIAPYTLEEAYEVNDAIQRRDWSNLREELGDLLLQVVFHARMAEERQLFDFGDIVQTIHEKMIRRHPHVFADTHIDSASAQSVAWEDMKAQERAAKDNNASALGGLPKALPALTLAEKIQKRAARVGFDWPDTLPVFDKIEEELLELRQAMATQSKPEIEDEFGDLLFACVNLGRKLKIDPEQALRSASTKFKNRFQYMEQSLAEQKKGMADCNLNELESLWLKAKTALRPG